MAAPEFLVTSLSFFGELLYFLAHGHVESSSRPFPDPDFRISRSPKKIHLETKTWALSLLIATQVLLVDTHTHI